MAVVRKPDGFLKMFGWLFLLLGVVFLLFGILSQAGVMKTEPNSRGNPGVVFPILACALLAAGAVLFLTASFSEKKRKLLLQTGMPVKGTVVSVKQLPYTRWGTSYPFVVRFAYECDGVQYEGKSRFLWDPPQVREHDAVKVMVDADRPKRCAVEF